MCLPAAPLAPTHAPRLARASCPRRYVDYTSKYGLGYLLNDGSTGVYFNDSTKIVLGAQGSGFQVSPAAPAVP